MSTDARAGDHTAGLGSVVVGVDESDSSTAAVRWAAAQVAADGRLHVVYARDFVDDDTSARPGTAVHRSDGRVLTGQVRAAGIGAEVAVVEHVRPGPAAEELMTVADAVDADAIVVGHSRSEHLGAQLVGHVTATLLHDSDRPVVIVPADWSPATTLGRPIAVGAGVASGTRAALRWAMERAASADDGLIIAHAHGPRSVFRPDGWIDVLAYYLDPTILSEWVERDLLELATETAAETGTDIDVDLDIDVSVGAGRTGRRLVEAGESASMLVIGRGEPPFLRSRTIAPFLRHAIIHAPCPVVVVPAPTG